LLQKFDTLDINHDDQLSFNESKFSKAIFDKIDLNKDSSITVDELKQEKTHLEEELNALKMPVNTNKNDSVGLSSEVQSTIVTTTPQQPIISSTVITTSSVQAISSTAVVTSSPTQSTLMKASPSSINSELEDIMNDLAEAAEFQ